MRRPKKSDLVDRLTRDERCLTVIEYDGTLVLTNLEVEVEDEAGNLVGRLLFNGTIRLPLKHFEWTEQESAGAAREG